MSPFRHLSRFLGRGIGPS